MRKLALLVAVGALWLFFGAITALADGGPHNLTMNNGTAGLSGDCASCHRAHTAQAANLLKEEVPGLCENCHNGTKATTDVLDGVQFVPTGTTGQYQQSTVLGALRGGGFEYALIDSSSAARLTYGTSTQTITINGAPTGGTFTLGFEGQTTDALAYSANAATVQAALVALSTVGTSSTYVNSTAAGNMSGATANNATVTKSGSTYTVTFQNELRLQSLPLIVATSSLTGGTNPSIAVTDTSANRNASHVGVLDYTAKQAVTSVHGGDGTVWGNGAVNSGAGPTVTLNCADCHNPHGNGQYRILQTTPGDGWDSSTGFVASSRAVEVQDVPNPTQVHNYTVLPGVQAADVVAAKFTPDQGDYFRYKYDPSGMANWTNYYLKSDPLNSGWNGTSPTSAAANGDVSPANTTGLMTAWCIQCHTRYNGLTVGGKASSLQNNSGDAMFAYEHGTTHVGCEQCHVSHGSNAQMTTAGSITEPWPGGTTGSADSRLLKVDNRGTCELCHDPTGTVTPGTEVGTVPTSITPGP